MMTIKKKPFVEIFTDGACRGNPGPGGWAAILRSGQHQKTISGASLYTTNNQMELTAAIEALRALKSPSTIRLITDSIYLRDGITLWIQKWQKNQWRTQAKTPVKNLELWQELLRVSEAHQIDWQWVKAHAGHPENEWVDQLANTAIDELLKVQHTIKKAE